MKPVVVIALTVAMAAAAAAAVAQNRTPPASKDVVALRAEVAALKGEVAELKRAYARHYHRYNLDGGPAGSGLSRTSEPAN